MKKNVKSDWDFARQFDAEAQTMAWRKLAPILMRVMETTAYRDLCQAADFRLEVGRKCDVATRIRRRDITYRDLTVRSRRESGVETEIHKLQMVDFYYYGWQHWNQDIIGDWMLIDVQNLLKEERLLQTAREISNGDGTWFKAISYSALVASDYQLVVAASLKGQRANCVQCRLTADYYLPDGRCQRCAMIDDDAADKERWDGVQLAPQPEITRIEEGPYKGFFIADSKPDPARATEFLRRAKEWKRRG